jgi:hypothetical protein
VKVLEPNIRLERHNGIVALKTINFPHSGYQLAEGMSPTAKTQGTDASSDFLTDFS